MRKNFANIAAFFIPLGFIGGLIQGSFWIALGSSIFWAFIFLIVKPDIK